MATNNILLRALYFHRNVPPPGTLITDWTELEVDKTGITNITISLKGKPKFRLQDFISYFATTNLLLYYIITTRVKKIFRIWRCETHRFLSGEVSGDISVPFFTYSFKFTCMVDDVDKTDDGRYRTDISIDIL